MLKIYTSLEKAKELSKLPVCFNIEARFIPLLESDNTLFNDDTSTKILQRIDGMTMRYDNETIKAKFGAVRMQDLSTGCKGLLLATKFNDKWIINIDGLGYNCIFMLFELANAVDIEVYSTRVLYHMKDEFKAIVNGIECSGSDISLEMERWV